MCTTISQLYKQGKKNGAKKFYSFKEFVTLHNEGKLDAKYYNGQSICPVKKVSYLPLCLIIIGSALIGHAIAKNT